MADRRLSTEDPPWLTRLRDAVLREGMLPATDEHFTWEGVDYVCYRRIEDDGTRLTFHEEWLEPRTLRTQRTWSHEIEAGAFAGVLPESVWNQHVAVLVQWLHAARPKAVVRERPYAFSPQRYAHQARDRRG